MSPEPKTGRNVTPEQRVPAGKMQKFDYFSHFYLWKVYIVKEVIRIGYGDCTVKAVNKQGEVEVLSIPWNHYVTLRTYEDFKNQPA